jgi:uncharacterized metal-binding protein
MSVRPLPVVFACSCGASAGRLANHVAATLDRDGEAEMAPIAAVGGDLPHVLTKATWRYPVVAIDGCHMSCARLCLERHGIKPARHLVLARFGVEKRERAEFTPAEAAAALRAIRAELT